MSHARCASVHVGFGACRLSATIISFDVVSLDMMLAARWSLHIIAFRIGCMSSSHKTAICVPAVILRAVMSSGLSGLFEKRLSNRVSSVMSHADGSCSAVANVPNVGLRVSTGAAICATGDPVASMRISLSALAPKSMPRNNMAAS